jgi:hypothetical protein
LPDHRVKRAALDLLAVAMAGHDDHPRSPSDHAFVNAMAAPLALEREAMSLKDIDELAESHARQCCTAAADTKEYKTSFASPWLIRW